MSKNSSSSSSGIGFTGLLTIAFIVLKLTHYIDWSWWWVLSPLWGGVAIIIVCLVVYFAYELLKPTPPKKVYKSKWSEKLEEMQKIQAERKKPTN